MGSFGGMEIIIILMVILLFFGAKRIPELARGIGQGMNEFRKASDQIKDELKKGEQKGRTSNYKGSKAEKNPKPEKAETKKEN